MAFATYNDQSLAGTSIWKPLATLKARIAQGRVYRTTVRELSALTDRDLADLGLHRADIMDVARSAAYSA